MADEYFSEQLVPAHRQQLLCTRVLYQSSGATQDVVIFDNPRFGRVLALDHVVQTTEKDEFIYHEMMTHVPLLAHGAAGKVLIIGGGDGGILRHVLMHAQVTKAVMVEIDAAVVEMSKRYLPSIGADAFDDPRSQIIIADGCAYVRDTDERFDVIIVDSTDNKGPGAVLFTVAFYADCKRCLTPGGLMVTQCGVPFTQPETIQLCHANQSRSFADVVFYMAAIPTYISGAMAFGFASDNPALRNTDPALLAQRQARAGGLGQLHYYTPALHGGAFALPRYVEKLLGQ